MRINSKAQQGSIIHRETLHPISGQLSPASLLFEEFKGGITILDHGVEIRNLSLSRIKNLAHYGPRHQLVHGRNILVRLRLLRRGTRLA